jgi:hypothetical protein
MSRKYPLNSYASARKFVDSARWPEKGKKFNSSIRLSLLPNMDIEVKSHAYTIAVLSPTNILEFVAPPSVISLQGTSLSQQFEKVFPLSFRNFAVGRYKVVHAKEYDRIPQYNVYTTADYAERHKTWLEIRREAPEYFQHLKLNIATGEVINPKDMTPIVNEERQKQWRTGLKQFRTVLRAMARVGTFDNADLGYGAYLNDQARQMIAEAIMEGKVSEKVVEVLKNGTSSWKARRVGASAAVLATFENLVKSNSRELRAYVKVITMKD